MELSKTQFPLNLAFACTIHKTQGITTDKIVVSFDGPFRPGQAYVALSRCKDIDGICLTSFDKTKIKTSQLVHSEMKRLRTQMPFTTSSRIQDFDEIQFLKISHINIRSLKCHLQDLKNDACLLSSHIICISESWLSKQDKDNSLQIPGFYMYRKDRKDSYKNLKSAQKKYAQNVTRKVESQCTIKIPYNLK